MPVVLVHIILWGAGLYTLAGVLVASWFVTSQVGRVDPTARGAGWGFRLMILPGAVALWPVVLGWARRARAAGVTR